MKSKISNLKSKKLKIGSALLFTLLIVGSLSVVAFGIGQVFISQTKVTASFEDGQVAFYDAYAGVEEGLRRFKANRNAEANFGESLPNGSYEGRVSYRASNPDFGAVEKDQTIEIATLGINQLVINATWQTVGGQSYLQITKISSINNSFDQVVAQATITNQSVSVPLNSTALVRVKPLGGRLTKLIASSAGNQLDSGTTTVSSTGSFIKTRRKLEAKINRQTGTLSGLFDYALLSKQSIQ